MDADEIFSKQLRQMEKEKKERDSKLKAQEKKVGTLMNERCTVSHQHVPFDRLTILSEPSVSWRFLC